MALSPCSTVDKVVKRLKHCSNRGNKIRVRKVKKKKRGEKWQQGNGISKDPTNIRNGISMSAITIRHGRLNPGLACDFQTGIIFLDKTLRRDPGNGQLRRASCCSPVPGTSNQLPREI